MIHAADLDFFQGPFMPVARYARACQPARAAGVASIRWDDGHVICGPPRGSSRLATYMEDTTLESTLGNLRCFSQGYGPREPEGKN